MSTPESENPQPGSFPAPQPPQPPQPYAPQPQPPQPYAPQAQAYAPPPEPSYAASDERYAPAPPSQAPSAADPPRDIPPKPRPRFGTILVAGVIGGLVGALAASAAVVLVLQRQPVASVTSAQTGASGKVTITSPLPGQPIESVARKVLPSVVNVAIEQAGQIDPFTGQSTGPLQGNGSGVILSSDGFILTNNHVVEGADKITVGIGTEQVPAKVTGTDPSSDLAVIKVNRTGLRAAELGDSATVQVGESVVAFGSPFGLDKTVTSGIVSALHRTNLSDQAGSVTAYTNLIQTDAAINPGNSGGALTDLLGRVIGINTLIQSPSGSVGAPQSAGIGFAIPIDYAKQIAGQLMAGKKVQHPFLGVSTSSVDQAMAAQANLPVKSGALVQEIVKGSPAEAAGIRTGDVITRIDGSPVATSEDVFTAIRSLTIGQKTTITVVRGNKTLALDATIGSR